MHNNMEVYAAHAALGSYPTVFQCELYALNQAASWIEDNVDRTEIVYFFSDSQATLQALNRTNCSSIMVMETIDILNRVGQQTFPSVCWVPGHMDIPGNERADELARAGSGSRPTGPEPFLPFTPFPTLYTS